MALVIVLGGASDDRGVFNEVDLGTPVYDPDGGFFWASGVIDAVGPSMELLVEHFIATFETPDDAALPDDDRFEHGYYPLVEILEVDDAVEWLFAQLPVEVRTAISGHLSERSLLWCRSSDIASWMEPDDDEDAYFESKYGIDPA